MDKICFESQNTQLLSMEKYCKLVSKNEHHTFTLKYVRFCYIYFIWYFALHFVKKL